MTDAPDSMLVHCGWCRHEWFALKLPMPIAEAANTFYTPLKEAWTNVGGHIENLETALREIAKINNQRDRFSADIDTIIINALEIKNDDA